ncbi:MAG: phage terminase large subunit family protein [Candidatus Omnitrophica bacterium]|nr:phage terminase large subunit family protein [Candidatus Omnitrophota bacterium]
MIEATQEAPAAPAGDAAGLADMIRDAIVMPDRREIADWAHQAIDFGSTEAFKGHYSVENTPWTRELLRAFRNPNVREITMIAPPQESGKTLAAEICLAHRACNEPAKMAFNITTNVKADQFSETKWAPLVRCCAPIRGRFLENKKPKRRRVMFRDGSYLIIQGAETPGNRQSDSFEVQVNDEVALWERPWLSQMHTRLRSYRQTKKIINISFGGNKGSELHERFQVGNQGEWSHHCPQCGRPFQYVFDRRSEKCNIEFDLNAAIVHEDGRIDLTHFEKTVFVRCPHPHCGFKMQWSPSLLARLNQNGVYVPMNPNAKPDTVSLHVNAFAIGARPWAEILEPWVRIHARGMVMATDILKEFIIFDLAEFWEDRPIIVSKELPLADYRRAQMLKPGGWPDEWFRAMSVDNQRGAHGDIAHRWFTARAFSRNGRTRLIDCGRLNEWEDVEAKRIELGIPGWTPDRPGPFVLVDRAYDPTEVDDICARFRWFGALGQDTAEFYHGERSPFAGQRMLFSEERMIDVGFGTPDAGRRFAVYYLWASQKLQDLLAKIRKSADVFGLPADLMDFCPEYADHLNSHRQIMKMNKVGEEVLTWVKISGWADHLYDCESMLVLIGLKSGIFRTE